LSTYDILIPLDLLILFKVYKHRL